jgi:hypothetical protein
MAPSAVRITWRQQPQQVVLFSSALYVLAPIEPEADAWSLSEIASFEARLLKSLLTERLTPGIAAST